MSTDLNKLENRLWEVANNLRANSTLSSFEYSTPVLLRYAWHRFKPMHEKLEKESSSRVTIGPEHYEVSKAVNSVKNNSKDLLDQVA